MSETGALDTARYVRSEDLEASDASGRRSWLWPWGALGLIGFLALTSFFMVLLRPEDAGVPINSETVLAPASTAPLGNPVSVAAPLPKNSALVDTQSAAPATVEPAVAPEPAAPVPAASPRDSVPPLTQPGPKLAILVMDLGNDPRALKTAIETLPAEVDLGFMPQDVSAQMKLAMARGHRVWLGIPMQPRKYPQIDPGPRTLLIGNSAEKNAAQLTAAIQQAAPGFTGVYNIMGSAFTANEKAMAPVLAAAQNMGIAFFDTRAGSDTVGAKLARERNIPAAINEAYLDAEPARLTQRLDELARRAGTHGIAVGVLSPSQQSMTALQAWLQTPQARAVTLVSARAVAATPELQKLQP